MRVEYECRKRNPLSIFIHGRKIVSTPAPSSGAVLLNALGTHAHLPKSNGPVTVEDEHRMIECLKFAYANRAHLGDPPFVPDIDRLEQEYISSEVCQKQASSIEDSRTQQTEFYNRASLEIKEDKGTSHLVAADAEGLVVSLTTTVGLAWGSRIITKSGIVLNNSLMDFSVKGAPNLFGYEPSPANYIDVNKRPLSSQCPFIIEDEKGNFAFAGGAAGGSRIISGNVQVARNVLQYGMHHPFAALSHRRLHHQLQPDEVILENNYDEKMKIELEKRGHKVRFVWSKMVPNKHLDTNLPFGCRRTKHCLWGCQRPCQWHLHGEWRA